MNNPDPSQFLANPLGTDLTASDLAQEMLAQGHWQARFRWLMKLGNRMDKLDLALQQAHAEVSGCESKVWLYHHQHESKHYFLADSDSRIVRGLLILVLSASNGCTSAQLRELNFTEWFTQLGLQDHLSPSRSSGLYAVVNQVMAQGQVKA